MSKHTLYYSTRCRFSQAFLEELAGTPYVPEFNFFCVDPSPKRPSLPTWLKTVPSLLVAGEATPRVGSGPVNNWLFERKLSSGPRPASKNTVEDRPALAAPVYSPDVAARPAVAAEPAKATPGPGPAGPEAYHGAEMAGGRWSDAYSFVGDAFTAEKGFDPISRNFQSLVDIFAGGATPGAASAGAAAAAPKQTAKEAALLKEYEAYTKSRDMDIGGPPKRI